MEQRQHQSIKNVVSHDIDPALEPGTPRPSLKSTSFDNTQKSDKFSVPAAVIGSKVSSAPQTELQHNHFDDQVSIKQEDSDEDDDSFAQGLYIARPLIPRALSSTTSFKASSAAASTSPAPPLPSFRRYVPIAAAAGPTNREPPLKKQKLSVPRSKTGCYTCRKRRIKCDEGRPACRNCAKGDHRCAGYDPALEAATARSNEPTPYNPANDSRSQTPHSTALSDCSSYPGTSPVMSSNGATSAAPATYKPNNSASNPLSSSRQPDFQHIDPSLEDSLIDPALGGSGPTQQLQQQGSSTTNALAADGDRSSHPHPEADPSDPIYPIPRRPEFKPPLTMAHLCKVGGETPPLPPSATVTTTDSNAPIPAATVTEIQYIYSTEYARGIDRFLETTWYSTHSVQYLHRSPDLLHRFSRLFELLATTDSSNYETMRWLPSEESQLVWHLMQLPRTIPQAAVNADAELLVVLNRLDIVEHLVTGTPIEGIVGIASALASTGHMQHPRRMKFWRMLENFVKVKVVPRPGSAPAGGRSNIPSPDTNTDNANAIRADALAHMRPILGQLESRDCLYSMAVVHHYGPTFPGVMFPPVSSSSNSNSNSRPASSSGAGTVQAPPPLSPAQGQGQAPVTDTTTTNTNRPQNIENKNKLIVAKRFLEDEASGQGTSQVVQRLCGLSIRAWGLLMRPSSSGGAGVGGGGELSSGTAEQGGGIRGLEGTANQAPQGGGEAQGTALGR